MPFKSAFLKPVFICLFNLAIVLGEECSELDNDSVLKRGYTYTYHFKSDAFGEAVGTTNDRGRMTIDCNVEVTHAFDCIFTLQLENCKLYAAGGPPEIELPWINNRPLKEMSKYPLKFLLSNGNVKEVYKDANDPIHYVNIKRGALSAFVFKLSAEPSKKSQVVRDIHGTCPLTIVSANNGLVKTSKDMYNCAFPSRNDWQLSPWSLFWNMSFIQNLINSTVDCEYRVNSEESRLDNVYCKERHAIKLESTLDTTTAVQTNIHYHMTHVKSEKLKDKPKTSSLGVRTGIEFEYEQPPENTEDNEPEDFLSVAQKTLMELVVIGRNEIKLHTITKFTDFVGWLRTSHDLTEFANSVLDCTYLEDYNIRCSREIKDMSMAYLSDALVQCQTVSCIKAFSDLAVNDKISDTYLNFVLFTLSKMPFTKPRIISHIMRICEAKDSRVCWLVLGSVLKQYHRATYRFHHEEAREGKSVINHFLDNLGKDCEIPYSFPSVQEKYIHSITYLKAIGNTGEAFLKYNPHGLFTLLKCVSNEKNRMFIRTTAIDVLGHLKVCDYSMSACITIHRHFAPLLKNSSVNVDLRLAVYQQLINNPEFYEFENELISLLKEEKNTQILSYIADDLNTRFLDRTYGYAHSKFIETLKQLLKENDIDLMELQQVGEGISNAFRVPPTGNSSIHFTRTQKLEDRSYSFSIFPSLNRFPQRFKVGLVSAFLGKIYEIYSLGGHMEGWNNMAGAFNQIEKMYASGSLSPESWNVLFEYMNTLFTPKITDLHVSDKVQKSLEAMLEKYFSANPKEIAFLDVYLDLFGDTFGFLTIADMTELIFHNTAFRDMFSIFSLFEKGASWNNVRVVRVIEAYHQVPTMMGLALNWTTNATLAVAVKGSLRGSVSSLHSLDFSGNLQHSGALTFLNRMVLDFPLHTQIGIQANSSAYSSMNVKGSFEATYDLQTLKIDAPKKPQKILELFRTNQIIKHNSYKDIPDWDIQRTTKEWCTEQPLDLIFGLKLCHQRSYPNVTYRVKPWAMMAGWCNWKLVLLPADPKLHTYSIAMGGRTIEDMEVSHFKFSAPGEKLQRIVNFAMKYNTADGTFEFKLVAPEVPELLISGIKDFQDDTHLKEIYTFQLSEVLKYMLEINRMRTTEEVALEPTKENASSKLKKMLMTVIQLNAKIQTPSNQLAFRVKVYERESNTKSELLCTYHNYDQNWNLFSNILPDTFWETKSKAYFKILYNNRVQRGSRLQPITFMLSTPKSNIEGLIRSIFKTKREQDHISLIRTEVSTGKVLSFLNITRDEWSTSEEKGLVVLNITIPLKSWNVREEILDWEQGQKRFFTLTSAKMIPKSEEQGNYVGWWSSDVGDLFDIQETLYTFMFNIDNKRIDHAKVLQEFPLLHRSDVENYQHTLMPVEVELAFPVGSNMESIEFHGKLLFSYSFAMFRFQKDFVLKSTYHNLQLDSHSLYFSSNDDTNTKEVLHNSYISHKSSEKKAFYNMHYKQFTDDEECSNILFNHNISSHVYNMASNVTYECTSDDNQQHVLLLNLDSSSPYWDALNMQIRQIIEDLSPHYSKESMNFTNPYSTINVTAVWDRDNHVKEAIFTKIPENIQLMKIVLNIDQPSNKEFKVILPVDNENVSIVYNQHISKDASKYMGNLYYPDTESQVLEIFGKVHSQTEIIWTTNYYTNIVSLLGLVGRGFNTSYTAVKEVFADADHPLNQMFEPALGMTLSEYISDFTFKNIFNNGYAYVRELGQGLEPIFGPFTSVATNTYDVVIRCVTDIYTAYRQKSILIWAIEYFEIPKFFGLISWGLKEGFSHLPQFAIPTVENHLLKKSVIMTQGLFDWRSHEQMYSTATPSVYSMPAITNEFKSGKMGMILGTRHVYTFDGSMYEFPVYSSSSCAYLLLMDIYSLQFLAFVTKKELFLNFPETNIIIDDVNEVMALKGNTHVVVNLPYQEGTILVQRDADVIVVTSPHLTVFCEPKNLLCTFHLSSWFGSGVMGLLGNYDGENYNDFMLPDGNVTDNVVELAKQYELLGKAECLDPKVAYEPKTTKVQENLCCQSSKTLCRSYRHLADDMYETCLAYMYDKDTNCLSEIAGAALCYFKGEPIETNCSVPTQKSTQVGRKLDVIFVVNQHISLKMKDQKGMQLLIKAINETFTSEGYENVQFSLIGFGGYGVRNQPSLYTVGKEAIFSEKNAIPDLLKTLEFEGKERYSPVLALRYAMETMGHNTFDSKVFIAISDDEHYGFHKDTSNRVLGYLNKNHVTLYTIGPYESIERGKKVYGIRADGLIFPAEGENYMEFPRGGLAKLTSGTKGAIFLSKFLYAAYPSTFFEEIASEIYAKVRKETNYCRQCKPIYGPFWYAQQECQLIPCKS